MFYFHYLRLSRRLTQRQLATLTDINQSHISLMELGRMTPTGAQLEGMALALGVSPAQVLMKPVVVEPPDLAESDEVEAEV